MYIYFCNQCKTSYIFLNRATNKKNLLPLPDSDFQNRPGRQENFFSDSRNRNNVISPWKSSKKHFSLKRVLKKNWTGLFSDQAGGGETNLISILASMQKYFTSNITKISLLLKKQASSENLGHIKHKKIKCTLCTHQIFSSSTM